MKHFKKYIYTYIGIVLIGLGVFMFVQSNFGERHSRAGEDPEVVARHSREDGNPEIDTLDSIVSNHPESIAISRQNEDLEITVLDSRLHGNDVAASGLMNQTEWTIGDQTYQIPIFENTTVYDAMIYAQKENMFSFKGKKYPMLGYFVTHIGSLDGTKGKNLMYYINGTEAPVGVSTYILQEGDIIEWKLK